MLRPLPFFLATLIAMLLAVPGVAQVEQKADFEVVADRASYSPGDTVRVAAQVRIDNHWHVNSHTPTEDWLIPTVLSLQLPDGSSEPAVTYPAHEMLLFPFADAPLAVYEGKFPIIAEWQLPADLPAGELLVNADLDYQACDDSSCLPPTITSRAITLTIGSTGEATHAAIFATDTPASTPAATSSSRGERGLAGMMLLGLIGGLILNAMPCVLPVLSLKVFGLVKSAGEGRKHLVLGSLATTGGILLSFWALAAAAIIAARAGAAVGWGVQFQQPGFVAFLAVVVVLFSLNMWGLFEVGLPQTLARVGDSGPRDGLAGHFTSGLFATLMATPCSAPFLGTAIAFALGQPAYVIFLMFTAIGLGLALPYLLLAFIPGFAKILPKPGAWMETFRTVMGFLLAAAAVWLFYVLAAQISAASLAFFQLSLLVLALFTWLFHGAAHTTTKRKVAALGIALAAAGGIWLAASAPPAKASGVSASGLIAWVAFDESEAMKRVDQGQMVFVDFTADWCWTCKTNERLVLETEEVAGAFESKDVVTMKGDWTNRDDVITEFLQRHGRSAVPFYILFRPGQPPHAFGELLTKDGLIEVLEQSANSVAELGS